MRQTIEGLKKIAERLKLLTALCSLFMSGVLITATVFVWYHDRAVSAVHGSYGGRIASLNADIRRLQKQVDYEQNITRGQLNEQANDIDKLSDDVGRLIALMEETATTAAKAANTARSAANTAQGAAANAAKSTIRITEVPPEPKPKRKMAPWGDRIEP